MLRVDVEKRLGEFSLSAKFETEGGVTALYGTSGAGKTSLVNMIAGLVTPDRGHIIVDGVTMFDSKARINVPPYKRGIGYVFQEGRLFPHMNVRANLDYGRRMTGQTRDESVFTRVVDLLGIGALLGWSAAGLGAWSFFGSSEQPRQVARQFMADLSAGNVDAAMAASDAARIKRPELEQAREAMSAFGPYREVSFQSMHAQATGGGTVWTLRGRAVFANRTLSATFTVRKAAPGRYVVESFQLN